MKRAGDKVYNFLTGGVGVVVTGKLLFNESSRFSRYSIKLTNGKYTTWCTLNTMLL